MQTIAQYVGLDVSLEESKACVVDEAGRTLWRGRCESTPDEIERLVRQRAPGAIRIGSETGLLDEATSALDYESERVIQRNMQEIARGRTVIIIAHRLSTVRRSDRIITIDRGRLVEDGTHDELVRTGGRYAALHRLQSGIHEIA
jgi:ABC-type transport system involved in cytochrome bd biosynthesis fused ATPase/permease subunit